ncbi:DUF4406 domain-containing protein [Ruminobacter sp. RM87]|uniref:DUF7768 domain-containing protein n=1 Tax=Ruminobacter sp. RM87 TaxID=1200567 RepID=UPI0012F78BF6|nr:DUF4406 domain-containing protein [Ruminobacter sp. RM87]
MTKTFRPIVYLCNSGTGDTEQYCRFALKQGQIPLSPLSIMTAVQDEDLKTHISSVLLGKCNKLWVFGDTITAGLKAEFNVAKRRRQPIRYFDSFMNEVKKYD